MIRIAQLKAKDREALFRNTAQKMGVSEAIVEKDFWVCWTLDYLFHRCRWKRNLAFKGGTSLSKAYGLIERFSEDIDLILDWRVLGYEKDEPWQERSNSKQDLFNKAADKRTVDFLEQLFLPKMIEDISTELAESINCYIDATDPQTVRFGYPSSFSERFILKEIRLEIGALAAWTPAAPKPIMPYAAEYYGNLFQQPSTEIRTVLPERTFWEKVTILHREAFRAKESQFPSRYSRHYYDLYRMSRTSVKQTALSNLDLLHRVVRFKEKFYRCPWAHYERATPGKLRLMLHDFHMKSLSEDYQETQGMLFGEKPSFEMVMTGIQELEDEINT